MKATNFIKHLLLPVTMVVWFTVIYFTFYWTFLGLLWMFNFDWWWLLILYIIGLSVLEFTASIPEAINKVVFKIYNSSWLSIVLHSLSGTLAVIAVFDYIIPIFSFAELWRSSWFKVLLMLAPSAMLLLSIISIGIFAPIKERLTRKISK